jgi:death-on-curing protein
MNYLTRDDLLDLHAYVVTNYGGLLGVKSQDQLLAATNAPQQRMFGADLYPDLAGKAAALAYLLIKNRPFLGGNEGTALLALLRFIELNGATIRPDVGSDELTRVIRALNHSDVDRTAFENWLRDALCPLEQER